MVCLPVYLPLCYSSASFMVLLVFLCDCMWPSFPSACLPICYTALLSLSWFSSSSVSVCGLLFPSVYLSICYTALLSPSLWFSSSSVSVCCLLLLPACLSSTLLFLSLLPCSVSPRPLFPSLPRPSLWKKERTIKLGRWRLNSVIFFVNYLY